MQPIRAHIAPGVMLHDNDPLMGEASIMCANIDLFQISYSMFLMPAVPFQIGDHSAALPSIPTKAFAEFILQYHNDHNTKELKAELPRPSLWTPGKPLTHRESILQLKR